MCVCQPNENISATYFKYGGLILLYIELKRVDPDSRRIRITASANAGRHMRERER